MDTEVRNWWGVIGQGGYYCAVVSDTRPLEDVGMHISNENDETGIVLSAGTFRVGDQPMTRPEAAAWLERVMVGTGQDVAPAGADSPDQLLH
jgi:hypothetical protein